MLQYIAQNKVLIPEAITFGNSIKHERLCFCTFHKLYMDKIIVLKEVKSLPLPHKKQLLCF